MPEAIPRSQENEDLVVFVCWLCFFFSIPFLLGKDLFPAKYVVLEQGKLDLASFIWRSRGVLGC